MRTLSIALFYLTISLKSIGAEKLPSPFVVIPEPQQIVLMKGPGLPFGKLKQVYLQGSIKRPVMGKVLSKLTVANAPGNDILSLIIDSTHVSLQSSEGYILTVSADKTEIIAKDKAGLFYGCQTLEQLLEDASIHRKAVPPSKIIDYPSLSYRAVHFDVRHHLDHMRYYYESIDRLARYKINAVIFEFEDKLRYTRQPVIAPPQAISIDEMAALTLYARERNIEISPLVQGLGHATFILKHQQYAHLRETSWNKWSFCPLNEGTYQVLFDQYRDAIDATPGSKYLHVGGDEAANMGMCQRCKPIAEEEGLLNLSLYWMNRVCEFAKENGRIPIFWDDVPLEHAGLAKMLYFSNLSDKEMAEVWAAGKPNLEKLLTKFPDYGVYMRWYYWLAGVEGNAYIFDWYNSHGLKSMAATITNDYNGMLFRDDNRDQGDASVGIICMQKFIQMAAEKKLEGVLCTAWDDHSPHMENFWRGFIASAEYCWSPYGRSLEEFDVAWLQKEFGIAMPDYLEFNHKLYEGSMLWYESLNENGNRTDFDNMMTECTLANWPMSLNDGTIKEIDATALLIDLPDLNSAGTWSKKYKDRLERSQLEIDNYKATLERLNDLYNAASRNTYYWEIAIAMYNLQITGPQLLLALKQCDTPVKQQQKTGMQQSMAAIENFQKVWSELNEVYSKTRFISFPDNYLPDRIFDLASQREDLTWMIQPEEKYHKMVKEWIKANYK